MPLFLKIFLIVSLIVNYLPAPRFVKNKYFVYFFAAALIGPTTVAINHFFKVNSYSVIPFISPVLLLALPKREIKQIIFSLLSLLILFPYFNEHKIIPLMISTLNSAYIIFLLCEDLYNEIKINSFVPLFLPFLIMDILRGTINYYLYYENIQLLIRFASLFAVLETITVLLIAYFGPDRKVNYNFSNKGEKHRQDEQSAKFIVTTEQYYKQFESSNGLTKREKEIILLIKTGLKSKDIAEKLHLSEKTVSNHRFLIKQKLGFSDYQSIKKYLENLQDKPK